MTDLTRLITSLKRRSAHAKEFGHDVLFVKLEDIDALVEAQQRNAELDNDCWIYENTAENLLENARFIESACEMVANLLDWGECQALSRSLELLQSVSSGSIDYCNAFVDGTQNTIRTLNAACVGVRETE